MGEFYPFRRVEIDSGEADFDSLRAGFQDEALGRVLASAAVLENDTDRGEFQIVVAAPIYGTEPHSVESDKPLVGSDVQISVGSLQYVGRRLAKKNAAASKIFFFMCNIIFPTF